MLSVRFDHFGRKFELRQTWPAFTEPRSDGFDRVEWTDCLVWPWPAAPRCLESCDGWRLRVIAGVVDDGRPGVLQWHDAQIRAAVARLLQQGRLRLYELTHRMLVDDHQTGITPVGPLLLTPSMLRTPEEPAAEPASSASAAPVSIIIDQDRQAEVLRRAAASGAPFCEECERRRLATELEAA